MRNVNVAVNYLALPERILKQTQDTFSCEEGKEDELLQKLFNAKSLKIAEGVYIGIEVVGAAIIAGGLEEDDTQDSLTDEGAE